MHDGSIGTLCDVARGHPARAPELSRGEREDLVEFLATLTESGSRSSTEANPPCP
jgi:hypothetical protein